MAISKDARDTTAEIVKALAARGHVLNTYAIIAIAVEVEAHEGRIALSFSNPWEAPPADEPPF